MIKKLIITLISVLSLGMPSAHAVQQQKQVVPQHTCHLFAHAPCPTCKCLGCTYPKACCPTHAVCAQCNAPTNNKPGTSYNNYENYNYDATNNELIIHREALAILNNKAASNYKEARIIAKKLNVERWKADTGKQKKIMNILQSHPELSHDQAHAFAQNDHEYWLYDQTQYILRSHPELSHDQARAFAQDDNKYWMYQKTKNIREWFPALSQKQVRAIAENDQEYRIYDQTHWILKEHPELSHDQARAFAQDSDKYWIYQKTKNIREWFPALSQKQVRAIAENDQEYRIYEQTHRILQYHPDLTHDQAREFAQNWDKYQQYLKRKNQ